MNQVYENYTPEDQEVWGILFNRQFKNIDLSATKEFSQGAAKIKFTPEAIPNFEETNKYLKELTGWQVTAVPGIVDDDKFFELLSNRIFPATTWLRTREQLDYLEEPDMFHDVFGHIPLLANQPFVDFLQGLAKIGLKYLDNPWAIHLLSRIYWFTIEFGLIRENGELKIYGAGIISSPGETKFSLSNEPEHLAYDIEAIIDSSYKKDSFQTKYFIIENYEELYSSLPLIEQIIEDRLKEQPVSKVK
ncbi:phenylalanine 4-monooxygenase [Marivirga sp. S37H4]|uniref:Phenylalanine 4-monooxygenase n=1 Tax=Marivirga aurantiaca TaxID=2802615 RepID=A0A934X0L1_9BACT|nr:phenylalanine 4-monooxygenase [Marivirga aurantiaca]MBK6266220.1 phenylalanine 4-monooxygenase [Marivirga aurantiaca]